MIRILNKIHYINNTLSDSHHNHHFSGSHPQYGSVKGLNDYSINIVPPWVTFLKWSNINALSSHHYPYKKMSVCIVNTVQGMHCAGNESGSVMNPCDNFVMRYPLAPEEKQKGSITVGYKWTIVLQLSGGLPDHLGHLSWCEWPEDKCVYKSDLLYLSLSWDDDFAISTRLGNKHTGKLH